MKILNTLQERHRYNVVHPRWATSTQKFQILIIIPSSKIKGYNPQQPRYISSSHSHSISHTITYIVYNALIKHTVVLQCFPFIGELPCENTTSYPIPWLRKLFANKNTKNFFQGFSPKPPS